MKEEREIKLEAIVNELYKAYMESRELIPLSTPKLQFIDEVVSHLYNLAEIRTDIEDVCHMKIEFED